MLAATLFDVVTSGVLVSVAPYGGISVNMSINYISPIPIYHICEIEAKITKVGRKLAFAEAIARDLNTGKLAATYTDVKIVPQLKSQQLTRISCCQACWHPRVVCIPRGSTGFC